LLGHHHLKTPVRFPSVFIPTFTLNATNIRLTY
jgi:hypothetical protein